MELAPFIHLKKTASLARSLTRRDIYEWFVTKGYFPEAYVLPPCFRVTKHPAFGKVYTAHTKGNFKPKLTEYLSVQFPKTDYTDRTFGIIDPELNSDIAYILSKNWKTILNVLFHEGNKVCSYSFPIPLNSRKPGHIGNLRSGRLIYEFIEMAENDVAAISYGYRF